MNGSLPHDWKSIKMSRFHGSMTRTENWPSELASSITLIWLLVASKRTVPRSFRGKYTLLPFQLHNQLLLFSKVYLSVRGWSSSRLIGDKAIVLWACLPRNIAIKWVRVFGPRSSYVSCVCVCWWFSSLHASDCLQHTFGANCLNGRNLNVEDAQLRFNLIL